MEKAKEITVKLLEDTYPKIDLATLSKDYKTTLQELTQATHGVTPSYELVSATGPDHNKVFEVAILLDGEILATAKGKSKKAAQQEAAKIAIEKLKGENE